MKICFATSNAHKIKEVKALLGEPFELIGLAEIGFEGDLAEDYFTIEENSKQKAEFIFNNYNISCFADDSGLEVYALNNEPGVRSARYAGEPKSDVNNILLLLKNLEGIQNRNARFKTIITLFINGAFHQFEGIIEGEIISESRGSSGFGYDPIFIPSGYYQTFAEMPLDQKNKISHRGIAVSKLVSFLQDYPIQ